MNSKLQSMQHKSFLGDKIYDEADKEANLQRNSETTETLKHRFLMIFLLPFSRSHIRLEES